MKKHPSFSKDLAPGKAPSHRQQRVCQEIRQILAGIIARGDFFAPELRDRSITITHVTVSPDLRNALIFVMPLGGENQEEMIAYLKKYRNELRYLMAKELQLRYVPNIKFKLDDSLEQAAKMGELFAKIKAQDSDS